MEKKMTKKEMFTMIMAIEEVKANSDMVAFLEHEVELLEKKSSKSGMTKTQKENEAIADKIYEALELVGKPISIKNLQAEVEEMAKYTNQKLSAILNRVLIEKQKRVMKTTDKKETLFSVVGD